jgi:hypothetical protein
MYIYIYIVYLFIIYLLIYIILYYIIDSLRVLIHNLISYNVNKILLNFIKLVSGYILRTVLQCTVTVQCYSTLLKYSVTLLLQ